jgi:hypothetical protein
MIIKQFLGGNGCEAPPREVDAVTTRVVGQEEEEEGVVVVERRRISMMRRRWWRWRREGRSNNVGALKL